MVDLEIIWDEYPDVTGDLEGRRDAVVYSLGKDRYLAVYDTTESKDASAMLVSNSSNRHVRDVVEAQKGDYKFSPLTGVGISSFLLDDAGPTEIRLKVRQELEKDGAKVNRIQALGDEIRIEAFYE